jgi:heme-degrading monooxygenase HmoA
MFLIRDVFHCKPGKAKDLAMRFKRLLPHMEREDGFTNGRVMVDAIAEYWTVVLEAECESLEQFEKHMTEFGSRAEVREVLAGYMELVEGGQREIYRLV